MMQRSQGIVIRLTKLTDTSLIVHWMTQGQGLIKTVAKGARRPTSPFKGRLDLFFSAEVIWVRSRRSELHSLREVSPTLLRTGIRRDYTALLFASYCCRLLEACVISDHPTPELYDLLQRALDFIEQSPPTARALHHFERELARLLGLPYKGGRAAVSLQTLLGKFPAMRQSLLQVL